MTALLLSLCLTRTVGFRHLGRLTRGGFAAGISFSLMREMEPFTAYTHFYVCVCVWVQVWVPSSVCMQREFLGVYVCGFAKLVV